MSFLYNGIVVKGFHGINAFSRVEPHLFHGPLTISTFLPFWTFLSPFYRQPVFFMTPFPSLKYFHRPHHCHQPIKTNSFCVVPCRRYLLPCTMASLSFAIAPALQYLLVPCATNYNKSAVVAESKGVISYFRIDFRLRIISFIDYDFSFKNSASCSFVTPTPPAASNFRPFIR